LHLHNAYLLAPRRRHRFAGVPAAPQRVTFEPRDLGIWRALPPAFVGPCVFRDAGDDAGGGGVNDGDAGVAADIGGGREFVAACDLPAGSLVMAERAVVGVAVAAATHASAAPATRQLLLRLRALPDNDDDDGGGDDDNDGDGGDDAAVNRRRRRRLTRCAAWDALSLLFPQRLADVATAAVAAATQGYEADIDAMAKLLDWRLTLSKPTTTTANTQTTLTLSSPSSAVVSAVSHDENVDAATTTTVMMTSVSHEDNVAAVTRLMLAVQCNAFGDGMYVGVASDCLRVKYVLLIHLRSIFMCGFCARTHVSRALGSYSIHLFDCSCTNRFSTTRAPPPPIVTSGDRHCRRRRLHRRRHHHHHLHHHLHRCRRRRRRRAARCGRRGPSLPVSR
jgi:hypothetical protein